MERGFKITELFAFVATEPDGTESIVSIHSAAIGNMPAIGADPARIESLEPMVKEAARLSRCPIVLARFRSRENEREIRG